MCSPTVAITAISAAAGLAASIQQANAANAAAEQTQRAAMSDANIQNQLREAQIVSETRTALEQGRETELQARQAQGTAIASAASRGTAGLSVRAVLGEVAASQGRNQARLGQKLDDLQSNYNLQGQAIEQQASSRIAANPSVGSGGVIGAAIGGLAQVGAAGYESGVFDDVFKSSGTKKRG